PAIVATAVMVYFNACIQDWWGSAGFGGRRFDSTIPLFCLGLAALVDAGSRLVRRRPLAAVIAGLIVVGVANVALIQAAHDGAIRLGETVPSIASGARRRASSTDGSAIRSRTPRVSRSRCGTASRRATTIGWPRIGFSAIRYSRTAASTSGETTTG